MAFAAQDLKIVRDLARQVAQIAAAPIHRERAAMWKRFNRLRPDRPMVLIFPEGSWRELLPADQLACTDPSCRGWEADLRRRIYYAEKLQDDNVISPIVASPIVVRNSGWGVEAKRRPSSQETGAAHYDPVIESEADLDKLRRPEVAVDWEATERAYEQRCQVFESILPVERQGPGTGFALVDLFAQWRGLEQLLWDIVDRPEWVHRALEFLTGAQLAVLESLEQQGALTLNNGAHYCGSGGVGFSDELPQPDFAGQVRAVDLWGFATTQIFSEVSPAMHDEFALRYEKQWLARFGLNAYGCCEPLHLKMSQVRQIPRLRRISMSPWVDVERGAAELGDRYIYSYKPNPAIVAQPAWTPDQVRRDLCQFLEKTRGCVVEMVMKDTHTCLHQPHRMTEWVRLASEEAERFAG